MRVTLLVFLMLCVGCSDRAIPSGRAQAGPQSPEPMHEVTDSIREVTEQQAEAFASQLQDAFDEWDLDRINQLVDINRIARKSLQNSGLPKQAEDMYLEGASKSSVLKSALVRVQEGASYDFLRVKHREGSFHPLFRMVFDNGGVGYHEFRLTLDDAGEPVADDVYLSQTGEWLTSSTRRMFVTKVKDLLNKSKISNENTQQIIDTNLKLQQMLQSVQTRTGQREALEIFRSLPEEAQRDKSFQIVAVALAQSIDEAEYEREIVRFRENHPNDLASEIYSIDFYVMQNRTDEAIAAINWLDKQVGGDPYLHAFLARAYLRSEKYEDAEKELQKAIDQCPELIQVTYVALESALQQKQFARASSLYRDIVEEWGRELDFLEMENEATHKEFVASAEFAELKDWYGALQHDEE